MTPAPLPVPLPAAERRKLAQLLTLLDVPDCECPMIRSCPCGQGCTGPAAETCPHCRDECHCPPLPYQDPCHHQRAAGREVANRFRAVGLGLPVAPVDSPLTLEELAGLLHGLACRYLPDPTPPPAGPAAGMLAGSAARARDALERWVDAVWGELLRLARPAEYVVPVGLDAPAAVDLRQDREAVLADRRRQGLALWHPGDFWRRAAADHSDVGVAAENCRNGAAVVEERHLLQLPPVRPVRPNPDTDWIDRELERIRAQAAAWGREGARRAAKAAEGRAA